MSDHKRNGCYGQIQNLTLTLGAPSESDHNSGPIHVRHCHVQEGFSRIHVLLNMAHDKTNYFARIKRTALAN